MDKLLRQIAEAASQGEHALAIQLAEEYLKSDPDNIAVLVTLAECSMCQGNFARAEEVVQKALSVDSSNGWALKTLAKIYRSLSEKHDYAPDKEKLLGLAAQKIEEALKATPENASAYTEAALIYSALNNKKRAEKLIETALMLEPRNEYFKDIKREIGPAIL